ncbi:MAG: hypothetical protein ACKO9T_00655, partial [Nitrospira sp.]
MRPRGFVLTIWYLWAFFGAPPLFAPDPGLPEIAVPEVGVMTDQPIAASSQQFIPDNEYVLQPQGR